MRTLPSRRFTWIHWSLEVTHTCRLSRCGDSSAKTHICVPWQTTCPSSGEILCAGCLFITKKMLMPPFNLFSGFWKSHICIKVYLRWGCEHSQICSFWKSSIPPSAVNVKWTRVNSGCSWSTCPSCVTLGTDGCQTSASKMNSSGDSPLNTCNGLRSPRLLVGSNYICSKWPAFRTESFCPI